MDANKKKEVPIWEKSNLTLEEAARYYNIGINKLRDGIRLGSSISI